MNYEKLIKKIDEMIPDRYRQQPVEEHLYDHLPRSYEINRDILKNCGELLYREFRYVNRKNDSITACKSKGELYIPETLFWINYTGEYYILAPFFLHIFLKDYEEKIAERKLLPQKTVLQFLDKSAEALTARNYRLPSHRCKRIIPTTRFGGSREYRQYVANSRRYKTEAELATAVTEVIDAALEEYRMEYWHFSSEAYRYANMKLSM